MSIRHYRLKSNLTQSEVAERLKMKDRSAIAKWETGKTMPRTDALIPLADLFNCTVDDLLREDDESADKATVL